MQLKKKRQPRRESKTGTRSHGAQPGNKNALKHGFYAKRFNKDEALRLAGQDPTDVKAEIELLRVCIDRLAEQLNLEPVYFQDKDGEDTNSRDDHYLKQFNTLALMTQSLATLARTDHLIHGKAGSVQDAIMQALEELRLEMGL